MNEKSSPNVGVHFFICIKFWILTNNHCDEAVPASKITNLKRRSSNSAAVCTARVRHGVVVVSSCVFV